VQLEVRVKPLLANKGFSALKASNSIAQGESGEAAETLVMNGLQMKPCKGKTGLSVSSLQDSISHFSITQGSGCCAASTLGFAVTRFQRFDSHFQLYQDPKALLDSGPRSGTIHNFV
jgi:hypothetical protein